MLKLEDLKNIAEPSRYTGSEVGKITKKGKIICKSALILPYVYEMAMNNITLRQMYYNINKKKECLLERCFAPMPDFEELLKAKNEKLATLESKTQLDCLDLIFTELQNPLVFTTFLKMLSLANIPFLSADRKEDFPVIIAGGDAATYPLPMSKMVDIFVIGDLAKVSSQIVDKYVLCKKEGKTKNEFLNTLLRIDGIYIPSLHKEEKIYMSYNKRMNDEHMPSYMLSSLVADAGIPLAITKGCNRNCNMCQHKYLYTDIAPKSVDCVVKDIVTAVKATGNTHISLITNCYADYEQFSELLEKIQDIHKPSINSVSFVDVKLTKDNMWLIPYLKKQYIKTGEIPTIIVGSPSAKCKKVLGIDISEEEILTISRQIFRAEFNKVKLKYVIGVPGESYEDLNSFFDIANKIIKIYTEEYSKLPDKFIVEIELYPFLAMPHTSMQYAALNNYSKLQMKAKYIEEKNKNEHIKISCKNYFQNEVVQIIARGDTRMCDAIIKATNLGASFDYIEGLFNQEAWQMAFNKAKIDVKAMLDEIDANAILPWNNIVVSTPKEELIQKYKKIMKGDVYENSCN